MYPMLSTGSMHLPFTDDSELHEVIVASRVDDERLNQLHRKKKRLPAVWERDHFATEGRLMFLTGPNGELCDKTVYTIQPTDVSNQQFLVQ